MRKTKKTTTKKSVLNRKKSKLAALYGVQAILLVALLLLIIFVIAFRTPKPLRATPQEVEQAKSDISALFADRVVEQCPHPDFPETKDNQYGYVIDYRYLRFNQQANRAIISSCNDADTLLAKTKSGKWIETTVNLTINNRVNPIWQKACLIEDITVADDIERLENSSIDQLNLEDCKSLQSL